ncbi:MAG: hypothetical protein GX593_02595, partial [Actinomycetales bacterium]|nr:hypothetical protein [Actinomycetales bacterium]
MARVPEPLRAAACFPPEADSQGDARAWARVMVTAARELRAMSAEAKAWSSDVHGEVLAALDETARVMTAAKAPVLAAQEASGTWKAPGVGSFEQFRAKTTRTGTGATRKELGAARAVTQLDGGL